MIPYAVPVSRGSSSVQTAGDIHTDWRTHFSLDIQYSGFHSGTQTVKSTVQRIQFRRITSATLTPPLQRTKPTPATTQSLPNTNARARGVVCYLSWDECRGGGWGQTVTSLRIWQAFKTLPCRFYFKGQLICNKSVISTVVFGRAASLSQGTQCLSIQTHCLSAQPWGEKGGITAWHYGQI